MQMEEISEKMYESMEVVNCNDEEGVRTHSGPMNAWIRRENEPVVMAHKIAGDPQKCVDTIRRDENDKENEVQSKKLLLMASVVDKGHVDNKQKHMAVSDDHGNAQEQHEEKVIMARVVNKDETLKSTESPIINEEIPNNSTGVIPEEAYNRSSSLTDAEIVQIIKPKVEIGSTVQREIKAVMEELKPEERGGGVYIGGTLIINGIVRILSLEVFEMENGNSIKNFICQIIIPNRVPTVMKIPVNEYREGKWLKQCPYIIFKCKNRKALDAIFLYLNEIIERGGFNCTTIFETPGWKRINGQLRYVTTHGVIGENYDIKSRFGVQWIPLHDNCDERMRFHQFFSMGKLTAGKPMATILQLYTLQSILYSLFESANATPKYCIFIEGQKGTLKSSLALAMTQFGGLKRAQYTFMSSQAGLEAGFADYYDAVMLVDDLMPIESGSERNVIEGNLEFLVRLFGDGTGKMRNLDFCDSNKVRQYRTHGGCVFTGEYHTGCGSTLARMIFLHCDKGDIDIQKLAEYQNNPEILDQFIQLFLRYISERGTELLTYMRQYFEDKRRAVYGSFSNPRYGEYFAQLMLTAEIFVNYGITLGALRQEEKCSILSGYQNIIWQVLHSNDENLLNQEPVVKIAKAVYEVYENTEVRQQILKKNMLKDEFYYHMSEADLLRCYRCFCNRYGMEDFSCKSRRLINLLANAGAVEAEMEGNIRRYATKMPGHGNQRFLHIKKDLIFTLAGEKKEDIK